MPPRPRTAPAGATPGLQAAPDLFVLVRPPPSLSTHPLNLQIQLLIPSSSREPPTQRQSGEYSRSSSRNGSLVDEPRSELRVGTPNSAGTSAVSFDAIAGASVSRSGSRASGEWSNREGLQVAGTGSGDDRLQRIPSGGSTRSRGSTNSMSVRSETQSGTGSRRRVTPLLNLSFHSVLPTVVTDAGTDQRVAKFLKRGIELSGLAILDPLDLSSPPSLVASNVSQSTSSSPPNTVSPASSSPPSNGGSTNILSRFKKFTFGSKQAPPPSNDDPASPASSTFPTSPSSASFSLFGRSTSTSSNLSSAGSPSKFLPSLGSSEGAPTPRTVPLLRSGSDETSSTSARPQSMAAPLPSGYAFVIRKWLRDDLVQISDVGGTPSPSSSVRIEWIRASDREYRRMGKKMRASASRGRAGSVSKSEEMPSRRSSEADVPPVVLEEREEGGLASPASGNGSTRSRGNGQGGEEDDFDDGNESDPEDSERPWICTLLYPSSSSSSEDPAPAASTLSTSPTSISMRPSASIRRLQLATLRPAPHHPKLISTLLLPPTLPSIPLGTFDPHQGLLGGVLSNETLRDLVHVSAMWLAIREGLGGLAREKDVQNLAAGLGLVKVKSGKVGKTFRGLGTAGGKR